MPVSRKSSSSRVNDDEENRESGGDAIGAIRVVCAPLGEKADSWGLWFGGPWFAYSFDCGFLSAEVIVALVGFLRARLERKNGESNILGIGG